jgi:hypothetical protein
MLQECPVAIDFFYGSANYSTAEGQIVLVATLTAISSHLHGD